MAILSPHSRIKIIELSSTNPFSRTPYFFSHLFLCHHVSSSSRAFASVLESYTFLSNFLFSSLSEGHTFYIFLLPPNSHVILENNGYYCIVPCSVSEKCANHFAFLVPEVPCNNRVIVICYGPYLPAVETGSKRWRLHKMWRRSAVGQPFGLQTPCS